MGHTPAPNEPVSGPAGGGTRGGESGGAGRPGKSVALRLAEAVTRIPWGGIERRRGMLLLAWTLVFAGATAALAVRKPLWDDEFFTLFIATTPSLDDLGQAVLTGADQHPPLFYVIERAVLHLLGESELALRAPAAVSYWLMTVCLALFVARRSSLLFGCAAGLLAAGSGGYEYAYEARGYGLVLGFAALALLCWQRATAAERPRLGWLAGLAGAGVLVVNSHYYGVLVVGALMAGEVVRGLEQRRLSAPVWAALAAGPLSLALSLPAIRAAGAYSGTFWAVPYWSAALLFYPEQLGWMALALAVALGPATLWPRGEAHPVTEPPPPPPAPAHERTVLLVLAALPVAGVALAKLVTNAYHDRYVISGVIGISGLAALSLHRLVRGRREAAGLLVVAAALAFGCNWYARMAQEALEQRRMARSERFLETQPADLPIAVGFYKGFHQLSHYAAPALAARVSYLADPDSALAHLGHDTIDRGLLALRPWFPEDIVSYEEYLATHPRFLVFDHPTEWSWLLFRLLEDDVALEVAGREAGVILLRARVPPDWRPRQMRGAD